MRRLFTFLVAVSFIHCATLVSADQMPLNDGSVIKGEVQKLLDGKVSIDTGFAGTLSIDWAKVKSISIDKSVVVVFKSGQKQVGVLKFESGKGQLLKTTTQGDLFVPLDQIVAIFKADGKEVAPADAEQLQQQVAQAGQQAEGQDVPRIADFKEKPRWKFRAELGVNGQAGNTERTSVIGRFEGTKSYLNRRFRMYAQTRFVEEDGVRTANETFGGTDLEMDIDDRWFIFEKNFAETDEFEDLDLRLRATAGVGYFVVRKPDREFKVRAGAGYQHEKFETGDREDSIVAEVGIDYTREFMPWLKLVHATTYYPSLENRRDYRIVTETAGEIPLDAAKQWKLRAGIRSEFDDAPQPGIDRLDSFYFLNLVLDF